MKKAFFFVLPLGMVLGLTACDKDYTCTCTYNDGTGSKTVPAVLNDYKKSDAETKCTEAQVTYHRIDSSATCVLK